MVTYTTATKVKDRFEDFDTTLTNAKIETIITAQEGIIDAAMKITARGSKPDFTFDSDKHGLIEDTASALTAFIILSAQPTGQSGNISSARASLMGSFFWAISRRNLRLLSDQRIAEQLKGL